MKVLSLGAGVQSTTLFLMACSGEIERPDVAIFADTGWEPKSVYSHLERLRNISGRVPIDIVSKGNLRDEYLVANSEMETKSRVASMPLFTKAADGTTGMLSRQCTREYKIAAINKHIRKLGASAKCPASVWIGISLDEAHRMKPSFVKYTVNRWPLIERRMSRGDCYQYLESNGWTVPKSSCIGCPFHSDSYWLELKTKRPEEFADAVEFDRRIRKHWRMDSDQFLHRSCVPLNKVVFDAENQRDLFGNECEGMCGV